ncbi:GDSL lipase/acylhydrolase family protein [Xylona heveae TC161]|uniref:GDSL lipase/acylhydrolase family protein n=1 Tax=Xylona heveae (strain CBS 132557 / TC161) TaxID=1328760 RepID=A0A165FXA9_XYLHT|nr:GDSL lipase/acylhydrolase family protein [Xylona heveae TC161]KZF21496.1 GDSL lipase/acylhydrolase family protein [Xylona heveae TC161]
MFPYDIFFLFGDSLTQQSFSQAKGFGFGPALQDAYIRRLDVLNRGFSGYNSAHALKTLDKIVPNPSQGKIRFLTVFLGANDACLAGGPTRQHVPIEEYKKNLKAIIAHPLIKEHNPRIILITPPPVDEYGLTRTDLAKGITDVLRTAEHTKSYADAAKDVGKELQLTVLDLWTAFMERAGWQPEQEVLPGSKKLGQNTLLAELFHDGLHFNPPAYKILFDELMKVIAKNWPDQLPENLPFVFPHWEELTR